MKPTPTNPPLATPAKVAAGPALPSNLLYAQFAPANVVEARLSQTKVPRVRSVSHVAAEFFREMRRALGLVWTALAIRARRAPKTLVVNETAPLGDRRFVAVVQFERQRFLIGSSPSSVTLLAPLSDVVTEDATRAGNIAASADSFKGAGQ
jgi:hypothetical protein